jgi:ubiquinone biosynthesis protein
MIGLRSFSLQLMEFGFFHADPHPANTIVMYDGRVAPVDYGITGYLDEATMLQIANLLLGFAEHDYDMILDALWEIGIIERETMELKSFQIDLKDISEMFYGRTLSAISVKDVYDQVMQLVLKYHIRLPRNILLLLKTFIQTESLGKILGSDASLLEVTRPYAKKLIQRSFDPRKIGKNLAKDVRMMNSYLKSVPKFVHDILEQTAAGRQRLELWHGGFRDLYEKVEKAVNRFTVAIVVCASIIAASVVFISTEKIMVLNVRLFGIQSISLTALLGLVGYGIATVLGIWLIVSIIRSGRM